MVAGESGDTAILTFSGEPRVRQDFTSDSKQLEAALRGLRVQGAEGVTLDALMEALRMLRDQPANHRRVILMIAEKRVRSATVKLEEVVREVERQNALVYWLT